MLRFSVVRHAARVTDGAALYAPPIPLGASYAMPDQSRQGRELLRIMSSHDLLCERLENDRVRMHFARVAGENRVAPDEARAS